jgi:regulator of G-protein signaling
MAENLYDMLKNKDLVYLFREFLHQLQSAENLAFWMEIEWYKRLPESDIPAKGAEIYKKYFDPSSTYELNIDGKLRKELNEKIKGGYTREVFDACQASVWKSMELDCFPKFLQSPQYKHYKGTFPLDQNNLLFSKRNYLFLFTTR